MKGPVFFNLTQLQMPVGAVTSIMHRVTGVLLATGIPFGIYLLDQSLRSPQSYAWVSELFHHWAVKLVALLFIWGLTHHLFAGTRHLLTDIDIGSRLPAARRSAWGINVGALVITLLAAGALF
ncbi:MAG: succinate dehydrogenase, cytochrome b556 subunit [Betaproteobacteria bacterium]